MERNYYNRLKEAARQAAIEWQLTFGDNPMGWNELADVCQRFYKLGKRYGLIKEFRENGIPCQENHDLQPVKCGGAIHHFY